MRILHQDSHEIIATLYDWMIDKAHEAVSHHGFVALALTGGGTPRPLYEHMASHQKSWPWAQTLVFWGDERDVPSYSPQSNFQMVYASLLSRLIHPPAAIYRWWTLHDSAQALAHYRQALHRLPSENGIPILDLVLLGVGGDGHVASLFPDSPQLQSRDIVATGPGPVAPRWTLTFPTLHAARNIALLVMGQDKSSMVRMAVEDHYPYPVNWLPQHTIWFLDESASSQLTHAAVDE